MSSKLSKSKEIRRVTWIGLGVNLGLSAIKITAGIYGNSRAVTADGVHSLSDLATDLAILLGIKYWEKPPDQDHPYGHRKIETLVTLSIGLFLGVIATGIVINSIKTLSSIPAEPPGMIALFAAVLSIISKEILYRWTIAIGKRIKSGPVIANAWHHRSDAFSSIPATIAVGTAVLMPGLPSVDQIGAIVVSFFIFQAAYRIARPALQKLMDSGATEKDIEQITEITLSTEKVKSTHKIRTRYISTSTIAVDLHVQVDGALTVEEGHEISETVKHRILKEMEDVVDVVIHLEPFDGLKSDYEENNG